MTAEFSGNLGAATATGRLDGPAAEVGRWSIVALIGLLWCAALLIGWRRLAGALGKPLQPSALLAVGILVSAVAAGSRVWWRRLGRRSTSPYLDALMAMLPTTAVLMLGAALSIRGTSPVGLLVFWALLLGEEFWTWRPAVWKKVRQKRDPPAEPCRPQTAPPETTPEATPPKATHASAISDSTASPEDPVPAGDVLQQFTRSQAADGSEELSGWLRMRFLAGQRTANEHVAFCPPFARTPQVTVEQLDGPPVRIKTAQLLPYGARLDLKLTTAAQLPESVLVRFSARSRRE